MKISFFSLCVCFFTLPKTCLAAEYVDEIKKPCGQCCSKNKCEEKTDAVIDPKFETAAFIEGYREIPQEVEIAHPTPVRTIESDQKLIFKIEGMCCPTEISALKGVLFPLVNKDNREADLAFDLINAKLIVESKNGNLPTKEEIIKAVAKTGMQATLWNEHVKQAQVNRTSWQKYGPVGLNLFSAASLIAGIVVHATSDGVSAAFGGGVGGNEAERPENPPIATMALYSAAIVAGSYYIVPKAVRAIRNLRPDTNLLMVAATGGAVGINHWFEAASSMYLFSLAEILEEWNMERSRNAIRSLMELAPSTAQVVNEDGTTSEQLVENIPVGTTIIVRPGAKIPMDSVLISGITSVNQAPITGESMPIQKEVGDKLFAGTINEDRVIKCNVTKSANDSTLASIIRKVEEAQSHRAKSDQWIETFSHYYSS